MLTQSDIDQQLEHLLSSDALDLPDLFGRLALVFLAALVLFIVTSWWMILVWGSGYALLDLIHSWLIRTTPRPVARLRFWGLIAFGAVIAVWVGGMAVYLAFAQDGRLFFIATCIGTGYALFCLTNHQAFSISAYTDLAVVLFVILGISTAAAIHAEERIVSVASMVGGVAVMIYFSWCYRKMVADRVALRESLAARAHDQKLRSLGQLTSGVAHDFNNLLTVIGGNIELAHLQHDPEEQRKLLDEASKATRRGADLVTQLLAYSRKSTLNAVEVQSAEIMERTEGLARRLLPSDIDIEVEVDADPALLHVDATLLETAILNLIINARDAMVEPNGLIRIRCRRHAADGLLSISVEDTGPGMDAMTLERATEPFFTTKGPGEGTGLGLSMVNGFAEQSGGSLVLANRAGGGLVASILLPVREEPEFREMA